MTTRPWLVDKSALVRLSTSAEADQWARRLQRGLVRVSTVTLLESGYSARSAPEMTNMLTMPPISTMPVEYLTPAAEDRAVQVLEMLAARGQHRAPSVPDLLIAAIAEQARLVLLHQDKDFELIADLTGQPVQRLA